MIYGFLQSQADHTIFDKRSENNKTAILIVYIDDIVLTGDDEVELVTLKKRLANEFQIKDLGILKYFLGMEFARSKKGIFVNQRKYILDLIGETGLLGCKVAETPIEPNLKLQNTKEGEVKDEERYQSLVGRLIYLSHKRPDITFVVSMVEVYTDADWAGSTIYRRSTSGYCSFVGDQTTDVLTKGLLKVQFNRMIDKLAIEDIFKPA
ncbi:uncharacterized protein LOC111024663 [Momordica charantia]|uniref:Uncharacterized protein LOC111024663 n=1 Tax=Momordica charantia TaxID=3673 RepID=A0A6J1DYE0_MOMCH|nr:uncharacterized protein LOC111024663 [Momordica charantia]